jgi:ABC-type oligopeptide transport system ATPase subunit
MDYPAIKDVSLKIGKGEFVSIIGPSGSGKSTLLNVIGALDPPTTGRVIIDGFELGKLNQDKLALLRNRKFSRETPPASSENYLSLTASVSHLRGLASLAYSSSSLHS